MAVPTQHAKEASIIATALSSSLAFQSVSLFYFGCLKPHFTMTLPTSTNTTTTTTTFLSITPKTVSLSIFPAICLGSIALSIYISRPHPLPEPGKPIDNVTFARIQQQVTHMLTRCNVGRMLTSVFAVLFLWRMSSFYRQLVKQDQEQDKDTQLQVAEFWFEFSKFQTGLGLVCALINTWLFHRLTLTNRHLKKALQLRIGRAR